MLISYVKLDHTSLILYVKLDHTLYSINYGTPYAHQELILHQVIDWLAISMQMINNTIMCWLCKSTCKGRERLTLVPSLFEQR